MFTDGSVAMPRSQWLVHAGWGIYTKDGALANDWGKLGGPPYTSYRAELRGVLEACSRAVAPIYIMCDNQAVVNKAIEILDEVYFPGSCTHPSKEAGDPM